MNGKKPYKVGYRVPPEDTRFKPGVSGNPDGRPKRRRSIADDLRDELERPVTLVENGEELVVPKRRALAKKLIEAALKGDPRVIAQLDFMAREGDDNPAERDELASAADAEIVQASSDEVVATRSESPDQEARLLSPPSKPDEAKE